MGNLSNALIIVFSLGMVLFLAQMSILSINPTNTNTLYNCNDTIMKRFGTCSNVDINAAVLNTNAQSVISNLPQTQSTNNDIVTVVVQTISNIFDSIRTWISQTLGLDYLQVAINTPGKVMTAIGVPPAVTWAIGGLFSALLVFFFIDWMKGSFA